ncbi:MAG: class I SAM-dependent methyltransferase [Acidimicrobiia bacterium]
MDPRPELTETYDAHAQHREDRGEPAWRDAAKADLVRRLGPGARLLELGAGVGYTSRWFADRGLDVLATDLSPVHVEYCRAKGLEARVADMLDLDFADGCFDAVWAASCLMHVPSDRLSGMLGSIARILTPDGLFWTGTWGAETGSEGIWEDDQLRPKRFYSIRTDDQLLAALRAHFEVLTFEATRPEPEFDWHYQMALATPLGKH